MRENCTSGGNGGLSLGDRAILFSTIKKLVVSREAGERRQRENQ